MTMKIFLTSSNALYQRSRDFNARCALKYGKFDRVIIYDNDKDIDDDFMEKNKEILSIKRGAGLWLWKIYFVHKALMEECAEGDILFYLDAAGFFFRNVSPLISSMSDDIFAVALPYIEEEFTKAETFQLMDLDEDKYKKTNQFQASYMAFRKSERSVNFVNEWLKYGQDINIISPFHNKGAQIDEFHDHRMDQSIFSLLCKKYSISNHPEVTQFALLGYPLAKGITYKQQLLKREYPILIYLHRLKQFPGFKGLLLLVKMFCSYCVEQTVSLLIVYIKKEKTCQQKK